MMAGYYDREKRMPVNVGRVQTDGVLEVEDEIGRKIIGQNPTIFREAFPAPVTQKEPDESLLGDESSDETAFHDFARLKEKPVKEIRQLFQELIEEVGEGEVPPITVKKHDLIMLYLELQNKKAVG